MDDNHNKKNHGLEWYYKHREEQIAKNREWKKQNRERMLEQKKQHYQENKEKILAKKKEYRLKNSDKIKEYRKREEVKQKAREHVALKRKLTGRKYDNEYYQKNKVRIRARQKIHAQLPEVKARRNLMARIRRRLNPQSNRSDSLELQFAKNRIRLRDHNRCRWQGCNISHKEGRIDVHHIFPISEHPELETEERFMICYCAVHHRQWHRIRGDHYSEMIYQESNPDHELNSVRGRD